MIAVVCVAAARDHVVLKKPDIIVRWDDDNIWYPATPTHESITYPGTATEEEIEADLQRRANKKKADYNETCDVMLKQKETPVGGKTPKTTLCDLNLMPSFSIPTGWEDQIRLAPHTLTQEAYYLAPWVFGPPALLLLIGWIFGWIVRGFRS
jgi:hypothetical protein